MTDLVWHDDFEFCSCGGGNSAEGIGVCPGVVHEFRVLLRHSPELTGFGIGIPCAFAENLALEEFLSEGFDGGGGEERKWYGDTDLRWSSGGDRFGEEEGLEGVDLCGRFEAKMLSGIKRG
jgi:hypothetical protein